LGDGRNFAHGARNGKGASNMDGESDGCYAGKFAKRDIFAEGEQVGIASIRFDEFAVTPSDTTGCESVCSLGRRKIGDERASFATA
jgi:hypothetical protein